MEDVDVEVDKSISLYGLTWSDVESLEEFIPQTFWRSAQKGHIKMLREAPPRVLEPLERAAKSRFELSLESGEVRDFFSMKI